MRGRRRRRRRRRESRSGCPNIKISLNCRHVDFFFIGSNNRRTHEAVID